MTAMTPPLSMGEIRFYVTRAIVGAGLDFGIGEALGQAIAALAAGGSDPAPALAAALQRLEAGEAGVNATLEEGRLSATGGGPLSCLRTGIALADLGPAVRSFETDDPDLARQIRDAISAQDSPLPPDEGIRVDAEAWAVVQTFFARCLVPSTDESRLSGAGAGLTDED